jgi:hypothetical protein
VLKGIFMNTRVITGLALLGWSLGSLLSATPAQSQQFLVGAYLFAANTTGTTGNTQYQYDTNSTDVAQPLNINGSGKSISFALPTGNTVFTFDQTLNTALSSVGTNGDLGLFFSATNNPYNPTSSSRTPDLLVSRNTNGATAFFTPAAGTAINDFHYNGVTPTLSANGLTSFTLGTSVISVTAYSVANKPNGSFTLTVTTPTATATPEPGVVSLMLGLATVGFGTGFRLRRRRPMAPKA